MPDIDKIIELADEHYEREEYEKAFELFKQIAEADDPYGQYSLGFMYENGVGVEADSEKSLAWYKKAAEQDHAESQCKVGLYHYNEGHKLENGYRAPGSHYIRRENHHYVQAVYWLKKAAEQGDAEAQYRFAYCCDNECGMEADWKLAQHWAKEAAKQGHEIAQWWLNSHDAPRNRKPEPPKEEKRAGLTISESTNFKPQNAGTSSGEDRFISMEKLLGPGENVFYAGDFVVTVTEVTPTSLKGTVMFESREQKHGPAEFALDTEKPSYSSLEVNVAYNTYVQLFLKFTKGS